MDKDAVRRSERLAKKNDKNCDKNDEVDISIAVASSSKQPSLRSARSATGHSQTSTASRRRLLEVRAARERAEWEQKNIELEAKRLAAEKILINAKFEEEMALLESDAASQASSTTRVEKWIDECKSVGDLPNPPKHMAVQAEFHDQKNNEISELTRAITSALKISTSANNGGEKLIGRLSARDLLTFSGDPLDWLRFKNTFESTTRIGQYTDDENVARLQKCLRGEAWEAVAARLITATSANEVMKTLEMRFGRPELVLYKVVGEMKRLPRLSGARSELVVLATKVSNCVAAIQATKQYGYLHSNDLVTEIIEKLTEPLLYRWLDFNARLDVHQPRLLGLSQYLMDEAERICKAGVVELPSKNSKMYHQHQTTARRPVFTVIAEEDSDNSINHPSINTVTETTCAKKVETHCLFCKKKDHVIDTCASFGNEDVNKRWEFICEKKLCFKCMSSTHRRDRCRSKKTCHTCKRGHHTLLHREDIQQGRTQNLEISEVTANIWADPGKRVLLKVLPISIEGPEGSIETLALLDEGSTITLVDRQMAEKIGAFGTETQLNLQGAVGEGHRMASQTVSLMLRTSEGAYRLDRVRTVDNLSLPAQSLDNSDLTQYQHLKDIPIHAFNGKPKLLIGQDYWHLIISQQIREGRRNEPVASLTKLGWVLHGFTTSSTRTNKDSEFALHLREESDLHDLVKNHFHIDSLGIVHDKKERQFPEERRAIAILESKTRRIGDRWATGLLWKKDDIELPNNRRNAECRLRAIEKIMDSDPAFATDYSKQVKNMLDKDYAQEVHEPLTGKRIWFLPHFGVRNPNKPGKLRLVYDARAETNGVSLNTELLTGPDLLNSLLGVLLRFRERAVAVTGDIREMFLQVKIIDEDQKAQCFLWRGMDREQPPRVHKMTSMTFGGKSSPCTATFILRHNADEFALTHPRAVMAIKKRHYVDDYLDSVDTEEEMGQLVSDVKMIHRAGGFDIRGWASNRPKVLPEETEPTTISLLQPTDNMERTLGLNWKPSTDMLGFDLSFKKIQKEVAEGKQRPTKREMLKVIMSVFDPLGILSPLLIRGKILLQEVWRSGIQWDQKLGEQAAKAWFKWLRDLKTSESFTIPRCYGFMKIDSFQLHVFADASEQAYSAVAYLKRNNEVAFIAAKSRVAPLKPSTIPRLELQAALMGMRLGVTIEKEQDFSIEKRFFWTDSQTVWKWIHKNPRQNKPFISNRLSEIDELTKPHEWRWLPGKINVADEATRADGNFNMEKSRWIVGPEFLRLQESDWPPTLMEPNEEEEEPDQGVSLATAVPIHDSKIIDDSRFSSWCRLLRSLARAILFTERCRKMDNCKNITPRHIERAETLILIQIQSESFAEEIDTIRKGLKLKSSSKLKLLNPQLDVQGLLRVNSRLDSSHDLPKDFRTPIILDGRNRVVRLMIYNKHRQLSHHGTETLINELKQRYHIFRLRGTVRFIIANCVICKIQRGLCEQPMMAALPPARLHHHTRPFTFCGIDFFGPMLVTIGRRHEKRFGAIFTCFNTRAVHIELAASLAIDSTILAIRRMAARRGYPKQMYSDNGTNFRGADRELRDAVKATLEDQSLVEQTTSMGIEWRFNPPEAPHMGGVWERLVRSIKIALNATLKTRTPKEEVLHTLLLEAENIVNSRPLTHVSLEPNDEEALTPNHFLLGSSSALPRTGVFSDNDLVLRKQWRISQRLSDHFWSRWVREYLPSLRVRTKWTKDNGTIVSVGDLVLIADSNAPRNQWPRGKIIGVTPGHDGRVRIVDVATKGGTWRRPVTKIVVLLKAVTPEASSQQ